jgi:hypothetical protein
MNTQEAAKVTQHKNLKEKISTTHNCYESIKQEPYPKTSKQAKQYLKKEKPHRSVFDRK